MNELITVQASELIAQIVKTKGSCVPAVIEDVKDTLLFTKAKADMLRTAIDSIEHIEAAGEMAEAMIDQRDEAVEAQFYMKARLGELTMEMTTAQGTRSTSTASSVEVEKVTKVSRLKESGIVQQRASEAERIAANKWAVDEELDEKRGTSRGPTESGVLNRIREKEADRYAEKKKVREEDRTIKQTPRLVAEYLEATKTYRAALELAIAGAKRDKFDPASWNFVAGRHVQITKLMGELEELI